MIPTTISILEIYYLCFYWSLWLVIATTMIMVVVILKIKIYRVVVEEPVLVSLSDLYSELESILVSTSRPSSCPTLHFLLTTYATNYCLKEKINDFGLRRLFYFKQSLKNTYYSFVYTGYKWTNSTELIIEESKYHVYTRLLCLLSTSGLWYKINS